MPKLKTTILHAFQGSISATRAAARAATVLLSVLAMTSFMQSCDLFTPNVTVPEPIFSPVAGTSVGTQEVPLACSLPGSSIRYTTDGTEPSETAGTP